MYSTYTLLCYGINFRDVCTVSDSKSREEHSFGEHRDFFGLWNKEDIPLTCETNVCLTGKCMCMKES